MIPTNITKESNDSISKLIADYKELIKETKLKEELYKWRLVNKFKGRPNINAEDFGKEIKSISFQNLVYAMGIAVINNISNKYPTEIKELFKNLFNDDTTLSSRVNSFSTKSLEIYRRIEKKLGHHQDERTIATYLSYYDSSKYAFYKNSFYQKYCKLLNIDPAKTGEKYIHYLELLKEFISEYVVTDTELLSLKEEFLTDDCYPDENHLIFAQDILYQMLDTDRANNYWIFQGNPNLFDFKSALKQEILEDWTVSSHKDKIKVGDKVILWITGDDAGCYALAEITEEPHNKTNSPDDHLWKGDDKSEMKAGIKITHNLVDSPILKANIDASEELKEIKIGNRGTNFSATVEEYETLLDIISSNNNSSYSSVKKALDSNYLNEYISFLRFYVKHNNLHPSDERISFNVRPNKNRLVFIIGSRYALSIARVKNKTEISFISKSALTKYSGSFTNQKKEIEAYWNSTQNISEFEEYISEGFDIELDRNNKSPFRRFTNKEFISDIYQSNINMSENKNNSTKTLNTILYGPPGTGKTYNSINKALDIIDPEFLKENLQNRKALTKRFNELKEKGQIVFTTFHQSMSYEDFIEGIKPTLTEPKNDGDSPELIYEIQDGVFKEIVEKIKDSEEIKEVSKDNLFIDDNKFNMPINKISLGNSQLDEDSGIYDYCIKNNCVSIGFGEDIDFTGIKDKIEIRKRFKENGINVNSSTDFRIAAIERFLIWMKPGQLIFVSNGNKKLKAIGEVTGEYYCDVNAPIKYSQFRKVKWLYKDLDLPIKEIYGKVFSQQTIYQIDPNKINRSIFKKISSGIKLEKLKYVLIIDEINRGNVSSIFGELITLIEDDKRLGNTEELEVILPYSKVKFGVPPNLYIVGTMNTADRSVEALDTALRRRFSFVEMEPQPELIKELNNFNDIDLTTLLKIINKRIQILVDKDHMIGHSYFLSVKTLDDLKVVFQNKIIPLLQEYFFGDYGKIGLVLGNEFVLKTENTEDNPFAEFDYESSVFSEKPIYKIANVIDMENNAFIKAINTLLNK